eukprot:CAMPEP_0114557098 /NCGR_PEP_ID=MMETSP0114-20121206/9642_1 /TAXON_ID=31324 /ORGANISM="Goniomonas sp, Strain m" /LENGTH=101 /DNA_ID=CAMNT_0001742349 /DNA_START=662 /DNA_END=967 /DNA_ORIENTATION=+
MARAGPGGLLLVLVAKMGVRIVVVLFLGDLVNEPGQDPVDVARAVLDESPLRTEENEGNLALTEDAKFDRLFNQAIFSLHERRMAAALVLNALDLDFLPPH